MASNTSWSRQQLLIAFALYCQIPFGKLHAKNPEIIRYASKIGRTPSALAMKLSNIASLDPVITGSGRKGLSGASAADKAMWDEMQMDWEGFVVESVSALGCIEADVDTNKDSGDGDTLANYTGVNKEIISTVRIGQSFFRRAVLSAYDYKCCITGLTIPKLLVASHIVPWRTDSNNRLNPRNGLSLSMLHDKAFDLGIITINEDMTLRVSKSQNVKAKSDAFFQSGLQNYAHRSIVLPSKFAPSQEFLAYHRDNIFQE